MSDALAALVRVNLALAAAIALVLPLRRPLREAFGARVAYGLWSLAPLAALVMLLPPRVVRIPVTAEPMAAAPAVAAGSVLLPAAAHRPDLGAVLGGLWLAGVVASLAWVAWRQAQFAYAMRLGRAGPAVVGVLRPRIVTPADFARRYTEREQLVVLAHERTHILRHDPRINAVVALARCLSWFNPLVHLAARSLRIDQELACDAQVVAAHPTARRSYAEAMLKTQLAVRPLPLGCYWPAPSAHPLAERIALLGRRMPGRRRRRLGVAIIAAFAAGAACGTWVARPPQVRLDLQPRPSAIAPPAPAPHQITQAIAAAPTRPRPPAPIAVAKAEPPAPIAAPELPSTFAEPVPIPADFGEVGPTDRRLKPSEFGSPSMPRRIHAAAHWSSVEPGSAVRVLASMTDPDGVPLITDLTAFGSQAFYRVGYVSRGPSRYRLFTSVIQHGDRLEVTAILDPGTSPYLAGSVVMASGATGAITLPGGLKVQVTATLRAETPQEVEAALRLGGRRFARVERVETL